MLTDDRGITGAAVADAAFITKGEIKALVRALFKSECVHSINPDDKIQKELAAELVAYLLAT